MELSNKISAATLARTAVLLLALTNQVLSAMGKPVLPIESSWSPPASPLWPRSSAGGRTTASPLPPWPPTATWPG